MQPKLIPDPIPGAQESLRYKMPIYDAASDFLAAIASQKPYLSLFTNNDLITVLKNSLAPLNYGNNCIRFKGFDILALETVRVILQEATEEQFNKIEMGLIFAQEALSSF